MRSVKVGLSPATSNIKYIRLIWNKTAIASWSTHVRAIFMLITIVESIVCKFFVKLIKLISQVVFIGLTLEPCRNFFTQFAKHIKIVTKDVLSVLSFPEWPLNFSEWLFWLKNAQHVPDYWTKIDWANEWWYWRTSSNPSDAV